MNKKGFTLIEVLAVIVILALLSVLVTPSITAISNRIKHNMLESKINLINDAAIDYVSQQKRYNEVPLFNGSYSTKCIENFGYKEDSENELNSDCDKVCYYVYVKELVYEDFLTPDRVKDEDGKFISTDYLNPVTNESLMTKLVCVLFDKDDVYTRNLTSYIVGENKILGE